MDFKTNTEDIKRYQNDMDVSNIQNKGNEMDIETIKRLDDIENIN